MSRSLGGRIRCDACAAERLVAFSCKGRGVCPSCNARRMVEVAAHLIDHVLPPLPVRQWVFALPKRIRPFLPHNPSLAGDVRTPPHVVRTHGSAIGAHLVVRSRRRPIFRTALLFPHEKELRMRIGSVFGFAFRI